MATPNVPPRPQRNQAGQTAVKNDLPLVPPRPTRKTDPSPDREAYARSPLNGPPLSLSTKPRPQPSGRSSAELPRRPPSVSLPDIGHEGDEYSSFDVLPPEAHGVEVDAAQSPGEQTKSVSPDLVMHQPRASVPKSTAKRQIQTVTSTDSTQAAAAGIGRARPADDVHKLPPRDTGSPLSRVTSNTQEGRRAPSTEPPHLLRTKPSFSRSTSSLQPLERTTSRPGSIHGAEFELGIPIIGQQVPLLAMAGDVQAPTPGTGYSAHAPGIGFFNDGSQRAHHRKRSSRQEFGPPDSYGIRHDAEHADQFEKEWVRKHPQEAAKEGYYWQHVPKPETALSSEQLNKLVHQNIDPAAVAPLGTPDEHVADQYLSHVSTPNESPASTTERKKRGSNGSSADPLRKPGFPFTQNRLHPKDALDAEEMRGTGTFHDTDDDEEHTHPDGTPILARDELVKRPSSAYMHAAVTPDPTTHYDDAYEYDSDTGRNPRRNSAQGNSRPSSRPNSVHGASSMGGYHGGSLHRFISHEEVHHSGIGTPLEEIEEYEPLFPEDEGQDKGSPKKAFKKRPELAQHHFPSQDVWEDTPASLQYSTTVSTPDLEIQRGLSDKDRSTGSVASTFETPEQEAQRRAGNDKNNDMQSSDKTFLKPHFKPGVMDEVQHGARPGAHRFPSSDVWEDTPSSAQFVTTVNSPQMDDVKSPPDDRPTTSAIPGKQDDDEARATTFGGLNQPSIPSRPTRGSRLAEEDTPRELEGGNGVKSPPSVPAKPSIPARPQRGSKSEQEGTPLEKTTSVGSDGSREAKAKPPVPARPAGEKIASLKAGFMNDLNNRLKLGPQGPPPKKEPESEIEEQPKEPLVDARKSRAKGPARRKPAASPVADRKHSITFAISPLTHCWSIDEEDELKVHDKVEEIPEEHVPAVDEAEKALAENAGINTQSSGPAEYETADSPPSGDTVAAGIAAQISSSDKPWQAAKEHRGSTSELKAALAEAGAAPASYSTGTADEAAVETEDVEDEQSVQDGKKDMSVQTGETEMTTTLPSGEQEKLVAFVGGRAAEEGTIVLKDGKEVQS